MEPTKSDIEIRSYFIWEQQGRPHGRALDHWLQAQAELADDGKKGQKGRTRPRRTKSAAGTAAKKKAPARRSVRATPS